jgi:hypothetical protein
MTLVSVLIITASVGEKRRYVQNVNTHLNWFHASLHRTLGLWQAPRC